MIIRKYLVDNINEALFRIKQELGDDAYIINQKMVKQPGVKGFFLNKKIEVTVGLANRNNLSNTNYPLNGSVEEKAIKTYNDSQQITFQNLQSNNLKQDLTDLKSQNFNLQSGNSSSMSYYNKLFEEKQRMFNNNFEEKQSLNDDMNLLNNLNRFNISNDALKVNDDVHNLNSENRKTEIGNEGFKIDESYDLKKDIEEIKGLLKTLSIKNQKPWDCIDAILRKHNICQELSDEIKSKCVLTNEELMDESMVKSYLRDIFSDIVKVYDRDYFSKLVVVGPTGCGKTTTIAKLAGVFSLTLNRKVGLVNTDTVRIGSVEQLKMYADIMDIPYKYVMNLNDIRNVSKDMKDCDTILIDTVGRGHRNIIQLSELSMFVQSMECSDISLILSAGMKAQDMDIFLNSFKDIKFTNVIVTKLDETDSFGTLVNICYKTSLPISFITTGQEVPIDIRKANKSEILDMLLGEEKLKTT